MTRAKLTVTAFAALTLVSGCASVENAMAYKTGTKITPALQQQLKTGQTTREDATRLLGAPQSIETVGQELHYVVAPEKVIFHSPHVTATRFDGTNRETTAVQSDKIHRQKNLSRLRMMRRL